jgi:hypothetical protein
MNSVEKEGTFSYVWNPIAFAENPSLLSVGPNPPFALKPYRPKPPFAK